MGIGSNMALEFGRLKHSEIRQAAELATRAFNDWLKMDAAAGKPCHDYQKTGPDIWYASSLTVDPSAQGTGVGTKFLAFWEEYIRERGGKQLVFFTNSRKNLDFYIKRGYEVFDEREFEYKGKKMGSWSLRKGL